MQYLIKDYIEHYNTERPRQGLDNEIMERSPKGEGEVVCRG